MQNLGSLATQANRCGYDRHALLFRPFDRRRNCGRYVPCKLLQHGSIGSSTIPPLPVFLSIRDSTAALPRFGPIILGAQSAREGDPMNPLGTALVSENTPLLAGEMSGQALYDKCMSLAKNLWWAWHAAVINLFRDL